MRSIVISDIHLKFNDSREKYLIEFFDTVVNDYDRMIILGDFFEFWYGFKDVLISSYFNILQKIYSFSNIKEIIYIEGNHDFNMGKFFEKNLKITVFTEYYETTINNKKFLFLHGDTINIKNDKFYLYLRKFLRSSFTKFLMNNIPPYIILKIANHFSKTSRKYLFKDFDLQKIIDNFSNKDKYDYVISGHFHKKIKYENVYILGDWSNEFNFLTIDGNGNIAFQTFTPKLSFCNEKT